MKETSTKMMKVKFPTILVYLRTAHDQTNKQKIIEIKGKFEATAISILTCNLLHKAQSGITVHWTIDCVCTSIINQFIQLRDVRNTVNKYGLL